VINRLGRLLNGRRFESCPWSQVSFNFGFSVEYKNLRCYCRLIGLGLRTFTAVNASSTLVGNTMNYEFLSKISKWFVSLSIKNIPPRIWLN
jgi:hypothetical protein